MKVKISISVESTSPVLCIPKRDVVLRTEVTFMLDLLSISVDDLIYLDSLQISEIQDKHMRVHLVDHNKYDNSYLKLRTYEVASIVDHHEDENEPCTGYRRIERVGSCASLITSMFQDSAMSKVSLSDDMKLLLGGTILLDTINLDLSKGRTTDVDVKMFKALSITSADELFEKITKAKMDISKLSVYDLLRKDSKHFTCKIGAVYIASIFGPTWEQFSSLPNTVEETAKFTSEHEADVLIIMTRSENCKLFLAVAHGTQLISQECISDVTEKLSLVPLQNCFPKNWLVFEQLNVKCSRKVILPLFKTWLDS